jgi:hypothetical protein
MFQQQFLGARLLRKTADSLLEAVRLDHVTSGIETALQKLALQG